MIRPLLVLVLAGGGPCGASGTMGLPAADVCDHAVEPPQPVTLEIGGYEEPFAAWSDGSIANTVEGGQGSEMVAVRARLVGAVVPDCVRVSVKLTYDGSAAGSRFADLTTYAHAAGGRVTKPLFIELLAGAIGQRIVVEAQIGATRIARDVYLNVIPIVP